MSNEITAFVPQTSPTLPVRVAMLATVAPPELPLLSLGPLTARLQLGAGSGAGLAGELRGTATLAGARMELRGVVGGGDPMLRGTLDGLRFSRLAAELLDGVELPPELPDFEVSGVEMELHPSTGAFRVRGTATLRAWPALGVREGSVTASVDVERTAATGATRGRTRAAVSLAAEGPFTLAEGLACRRFAVRFALAQGESCAASGELEATVLEHPVTLSAEYAGTAAGRHLRLSAAGELTLSAVPGAELSLRGFALEAARETGEGGAAPSTTWSVGGSGTLTLRSLFRPDDTWRLGGDLTLRAGASGAALALVFGPGSALPVTLPLGPGRTLRLTLAPERLELRRDAAGWAFEAASS
ncbi:MAG TPA: hypothetical protein VFJ82_17005, partial [Longimicrobium sp.]|nr:hypothetical protein [Longimicrobium sp.]